MTTSNKTKPKGNVFDEEITSVFQIEVAPSKRSRFELDIEVITEDEQYMLDVFHGQAVATEGRNAIGQLLTDHISDLADHAAYEMTKTTEKINRYAEAAQLGRYQERHYGYTARLLDSTWRHVYQANEIAARSMFEDTRRPIYRPHQPERLRRKGVVRGFQEFLFGEE